MYSRSYYDTMGEIREIPAGYDGTALSEIPPAEEAVAPIRISEEIQKVATKISPEEERCECEEGLTECSSSCNTSEDGGFLSYIKGFFPSFNILPHLPKKIEIEDLIILGLALYLFFSKTGDKECAIMLAILIFL